jgi:hypothetical protein
MTDDHGPAGSGNDNSGNPAQAAARGDEMTINLQMPDIRELKPISPYSVSAVRAAMPSTT